MQIVFYGQGSATGGVTLTFNSDTATHYAFNGSYQNNTSSPAPNGAVSQASCPAAFVGTSVASSSIMDIPFYATTAFGKIMTLRYGTISSLSSGTDNYDQQRTCGWDDGSHSAITSITFTAASGHLIAGTQFMILVQD